MRLYTAQILLLTACVGISTVSAFGPSSVPSKNEAIIGRRPASALSVSATVDETEAPPATVTFDDVRSMTFRQLQRSCVDKGLPAVGNTATLRSRILEAYGLATVPAASNASAASDEVRHFIAMYLITFFKIACIPNAVNVDEKCGEHRPYSKCVVLPLIEG